MADILPQLNNTIIKAHALMSSIEVHIDSAEHAMAIQSRGKLERMQVLIASIIKAYEHKLDAGLTLKARVCCEEVAGFLVKYQVPRLEVLLQHQSNVDAHTTNSSNDNRRTTVEKDFGDSCKIEQPEITTAQKPNAMATGGNWRGFRELTLNVTNAKALMSEMERNLPDRSNSMDSYRQLARICHRIYGDIASYRHQGLFEGCDEVLQDRDNIKAFVELLKKYFPKNVKNPRPIPQELFQEFKRDCEYIRHSRAGSEYRNESDNSHQKDITDLTHDSDDDLVITVDDSDGDIEAREERARAVLQAEREGWLDYEYRRDVVLWYRPESDFQDEFLP